MRVSSTDCPMCGGKHTLEPLSDLFSLTRIRIGEDGRGGSDQLTVMARVCRQCRYMDLHFGGPD